MGKTALQTIIILLSISNPAFAYLGPGLAGGAIASVIGLIGVLLLALFGILYYPIKRALKNRGKKEKL